MSCCCVERVGGTSFIKQQGHKYLKRAPATLPSLPPQSSAPETLNSLPAFGSLPAKPAGATCDYIKVKSPQWSAAVPPAFILFLYTSYSFQVFGERLACSYQLCMLGIHSSLFGMLGVIVCLYAGSSFFFVWNAGCYCLFVCWELILLCLESWVLLFVVYAGSSFFFVWNPGCYCMLCMLGAHSSLFGMLGVIVCCVCWDLILLCLECWVLLFVVYAGSSFFFVWNAGCCCLLYMLGAHSSLFGMLGVIVCCVCWELILLCLECCLLLFVFSAGRLLLFGVNDGPCLLFVLGSYFLCSHQITTGRPNNFCRKLYV